MAVASGAEAVGRYVLTTGVPEVAVLVTNDVEELDRVGKQIGRTRWVGVHVDGVYRGSYSPEGVHVSKSAA